MKHEKKMTSYFRRKIAERVISFSNSRNSIDSFLLEDISKNISINKKKCGHIEFVLPLKPSSFGEQLATLQDGAICSTLQQNATKIQDKSFITACELEANEKSSNLIFRVNHHLFAQKVLHAIVEDPSGFWKSSCLLQLPKPKNIVVEYSSPNIAKPFHVGHLRSTVIGNFVANIKNVIGHKVFRLNYLGDWGTQFGLLCIGFKAFGSEDELQKNPIGHLFKVYVAANDLMVKDNSVFDEAKAFFTKMENGDKEALSQWKQFRKLSIEELQSTYKHLGIQFDAFHGESMYGSKAEDILGMLQERNLLLNRDGAYVMELEFGKQKMRTVPLKKKDGSTLYLSRDVAAAVDRKEKFEFDEMYYVVENGQSDHFTALFGIIEKMGLDWHRCLHHVKFGRIRKMSTRKGNVFFLSDLLDEAKERTLEAMKKSPNTRVTGSLEAVADVLGTSAVFVNDMMSRRGMDYDFSWERVVQTKGSTGPQLQYTHARLWSLQNSCGVNLTANVDAALLAEPEAIHLIRCLARFDEVISEANQRLEPCVVVVYLFQLCDLVHAATAKLRVKGERQSLAQARLFLFVCARIVLHSGMKILGLHPLEEM